MAIDAGAGQVGQPRQALIVRGEPLVVRPPIDAPDDGPPAGL